MTAFRTRRTTLHDVAEHAGVSYQTVSRVINDHPHVAEGTRERILHSIQELGYYPNNAARSLVTARSYTLGIVGFGTDYYGPAQMVANLERAAKRRGYRVTLSTIADLNLEMLKLAIDNLSGQLVDGLLMITPITTQGDDRIEALCGNMPFVQIDPEQGTGRPSVVIDQHYGSQLATHHLLDLGHRAICEISGPLNWHGAQSRHMSWCATLQKSGIEPRMSVEGDWTAASGYHSAHRLVAEGTDFTGLVVGNDQMALGAIRALRERGLSIPDDVSIVGFDDIPEAAYFEPPLTTVRQEFTALGEQSVDYLVALIEGQDVPLEQRVLYPQLVVRQSTRAQP